VGGETVQDIAFRLFLSQKNEPPKTVDFFFEKATKLFSKKKEVLLKMAELDPYGSWIQSGARFIKTGKTLS